MDGDGDGMVDALARHEAMASSHPTSACQGFGSAPYKMHGGFWYQAHQVAPALAMRDTFVARPTAVILATLPMSSTTWLKALVFAVTCRGRRPPDDAGRHLFLRSSPHDLVPFLHYLYAKHRSASASVRVLEAMPSPRVLAVHAPLSALPASVVESGCRVVYLGRDPKDALVSLWHYAHKANPAGSTPAPFREIFTAFCDSVSPLGPRGSTWPSTGRRAWRGRAGHVPPVRAPQGGHRGERQAIGGVPQLLVHQRGGGRRRP